MDKCRALILVLALSLCFLPQRGSAQLRRNFYANICPNVETIVRNVVRQKLQQTFVTVPATLRLFFHYCATNGCDASIMIASTGNNKAEKDHPDNLSIAGDGFDTVTKAKAALDAIPQCRNKISCADILAMAARDVVALAGGPSYAVELGRKDGLVSRASSVNLPHPTHNLDQLTARFAQMGLSRTDMIALSAAHTLGASHCSKFASRIFGPRPDPTLNRNYATQLRQMCLRDANPAFAIQMDPVTPRTFDNQYYKNLQHGMGLFTDGRSRPTVNTLASNPSAFNQAFITAMTKLGRVGVKTGNQGNIRRNCAAFN